MLTERSSLILTTGAAQELVFAVDLYGDTHQPTAYCNGGIIGIDELRDVADWLEHEIEKLTSRGAPTWH